ncbi:MAG: hypothetical protein AAGA73_04195 [Pseudomonadota bacterium]
MHDISNRRSVTVVIGGLMVLAASSSLTLAADLPPLVSEAFKAMETTPSNQWAYRMTTTDQDGTAIEQFDPSSPAPHWELLEVDGKVPDRSDLKDYEEGLKELELPNLADDFAFSDLVDSRSLVLKSESDRTAIFSFNLAAEKDDDDAEVAKFLAGTLTINKSPAYVSAVELGNKEPFSPEIGVNVIDMNVRVTFQPLGKDGPYFLTSAAEKVEAKAFGFMNVSENETITLSDYVHVGNK